MTPTADPPLPSTPGHAFHSLVKCCTFLPDLPNFLVGAVLTDDTEDARIGRETIVQRVERGTGVTPLRLQKTPLFSTIYTASSKATFGKAVALRCPHYIESTGGCGIWRYREAVCSTWFCKHQRGAIGSAFWTAMRLFLQVVEYHLSIKCAAAAGATSSMLKASLKARAADPAELIAGELVVDQHEQLASSLWESWRAKEPQFFVRCYEVARDLSWTDIRAIGGEELRAREAILLEAYQSLVSDSVPERLTLASAAATRVADGWYQVATYSGNNPIAIPAPVWASLSAFDGRTTSETLQSLPSDVADALLDDELLPRLVDYGVLKGV